MLRKERSLSLRQFALSIRTDKTFLSNIENGRQSPTLDTIERIASGLDVTMSFLLYGVEEENSPEQPSDKTPECD